MASDPTAAAFEVVQRAAEALPEVEVSTSYGTPSLKVRKTSFCRMWSEREHARDDIHDTPVLVLFCDGDEKQAIIDSSNGAVFETPHYENYPAFLVRLDDVAFDDLVDLLEDSYRQKAPKTLIRTLDEPS